MHFKSIMDILNSVGKLLFRSYLRFTFSIAFLCFLIDSSLAQDCPIADFSVSPTVCLDQDIDIVNNTTGAMTYEWDFCVGVDLSISPVLSEVSDGSDFGSSYDIDLVEDEGNYYGFVATLTGDKIIMLSFGDSIGTAPIYTDLGGGGIINDPISISVVKSDGNWHGFAVSNTVDELYYLSFGNSLSNTPVISDITGSLNLDSPISVEAVSDNGNDFLFIVNQGNKIVERLEFPTGYSSMSFTSSAPISVSGLSDYSGITLVQDCDSWYGFLVSRNGAGIIRLDFGTTLSAVPVESIISGSLGITMSRPTGITILQEDLNYYGFLTSRDASLYRIEFGTDISSLPTGVDLGNVNGLSRDWGISSVKSKGEWFLLGANFTTGQIFRYEYANNCQASTFTSNDILPSGISFTASGMYSIGLTAWDANGHVSRSVDQLTVLTSVAPDIDFTIDDSRCIANVNQFTSINISGDITSYSWDFDGDGMEDSTDPNPTFQYATPGSYESRLTVMSSDCENTVVKTMTIYPEPLAPTDFTVTSSSTFCSASELDFGYAVEPEIADTASFIWDFNGEGMSALKDPSFTFSSPGIKTVSLQVVVPGCTTSVYSEDIEIFSGPTASFSYTGNCFGEAIAFTDESIGGENNRWDFGDGSPEEVDVSSPSHTYVLAGMYDITLEVTNSAGCQTEYEATIEVTDNDLTSFTVGEIVENIPVLFTGIDQTLADNSIETWTWDFGGLGTANGQNPEFAFSTPSTYTIQLDVTTTQGCDFTYFSDVEVIGSICPTVDFTIPAEVCIDEEVSFANTSINATSYEWDFCAGVDLSGSLVLSEVSSVNDFGSSYDIDLVVDEGNYYGFVPTFTGDRIVKLSFGDSVGTSPFYTDLGGEDIFKDPISISVVESSGNWHGFAVSNTNDELYHLSFGNSLSNDPEITDITGGLNLNSPIAVEAISDNENDFLFIVNQGSQVLERLDFTDGYSSMSFVSDPISISSLSDYSDLSFVQDCDSWYGFLVSRNSNGLIRLDFGDSLINVPVETNMSAALGITLSRPTGITILREGLDYYGFIASRDTSLYRIDFGPDISSVPAGVDLGNVNGLSRDWGISSVKSGGEWFLLGANFTTGQIFQYKYFNDCPVSIFTSADVSPSGISFEESGTYSIGLTARDANGHVSRSVDQLTVSTAVTPDIDFTIDDNRCISNSNQFTSINTSGDIDTYNWNFGDGIGTSIQQDTSYQYGATGSYQVTLNVENTTTGCTNSVSDSISIYPVPAPIFDISATGTLCNNGGINFINQTNETAYPNDLVTYQWNLAGEATSHQADTTYIFETSGNKTITLQASIPGCSSSKDSIITLLEGPIASFGLLDNCQNETSVFTAHNQEGTSTYIWDFGDGFSLTGTDVTHVYTNTGNYNVTLSVENQDNCVNTSTDELTIHALPNPGFISDPLCSHVDILFTDTSKANNAVITKWNWDFGNGQTSAIKNPVATFEGNGNYDVTLNVTTNFLCQQTLIRTIAVMPTTELDIVTDSTCEGDIAKLWTEIINTNDINITDFAWEVNGEVLAVDTLKYQFPTGGLYPLRLTYDMDNGCIRTIDDSVTIDKNPKVSFMIQNACTNDLTIFTDKSIDSSATIVSRTWTHDGELFGSGKTAVRTFSQANNELIKLEVVSENGCMGMFIDTAFISDPPIAAFEIDPVTSFPTSTELRASTLSDSLIWFVGDADISFSNDAITSYTIIEEGAYDFKLVTFDNGCKDTAVVTLQARIPELDIALDNLTFIRDNGDIILNVLISNKGTIALSDFDIDVNVSGRSTFSETYLKNLSFQEKDDHRLLIKIPDNNNLYYICASVALDQEDAQEIVTEDNKVCVNIGNAILSAEPHPNPASDYIIAEVVTAASGTEATVTLTDMAGNTIVKEIMANMQKGLNTLHIPLGAVSDDVYILTIQSGAFNRSTKIKIIK